MKARATSTQPRSNQAGPAADFIDSIDPKRTIWLCSGQRGACSDGDNLARTAVIPSANAHIVITGTPDLGADGEDYRANFVHAPFPEKISKPSALLSGAWFGGCQPAKHRSRCDPKRHDDE
jgi:hypothetical protein